MSDLQETADGHSEIFEESLFSAAGAVLGEPPRVLVEIPHGATDRDSYDKVRRRLRGSFPEDLEAFFHVNTDVGAPEVGREVARRLAADGVSVLLLRSLLPRTFADCNRSVEHRPLELAPDGATPSIAAYVTDPSDRSLLERLLRGYQRAAERAYDLVCGHGGTALALHTYAPRSVTVERVDGDVVRALRRAYEPERYRQWRLRPEVDVITTTPSGKRLADQGLVDAVREGYRAIGVDAAENATYRLMPVTQGAVFAARYPRQVLCLEIRRDLLAEAWIPFAPVRIAAAKVERMAAPIAASLAALVADQGASAGSLRPNGSGC